jgi:hypothetical protein
MNKIYWIFKATCWKWDEYKWIVGFGAMFFDNLPTSGQMLVVIFLIWVSLSMMILFEVFLMGIPMKGIVILEYVLQLLVVGMVYCGLLDWLCRDQQLMQRKRPVRKRDRKRQQQQQCNNTVSTPENWVWSGTEEESIKDWWNSFRH